MIKKILSIVSSMCLCGGMAFAEDDWCRSYAIDSAAKIDSSAPQKAIQACTEDINGGRYAGWDGHGRNRLAERYNYRAWGYSSLGDIEKAIADYGKVINLDPKWSAGYVNRAKLLIKSGDYDRAITDYTAVIAFDPANYRALTDRGEVYLKKGEHDKAFADFSKAISLDSEFIPAYEGRAKVYAVRGEKGKASVDQEKANALLEAAMKKLLGK